MIIGNQFIEYITDNHCDLYTTKRQITLGLSIGELKEQLSNIIHSSIKVGKILTAMKCTSNTLKSVGNYNSRYSTGSLWEQYTLDYLEIKYPKNRYELTIGKNTCADIIAYTPNGSVNIEVKSETLPNTSHSCFIKAKQWNNSTNCFDNSNLYSGLDSDIWIHYFLYNDKWHTFNITKGKLKQLCASLGKQIIINSNINSKAAQLGYLLPVDCLVYSLVEIPIYRLNLYIDRFSA